MFYLLDQYIILKLKSMSFCTQRICCLLSFLFFINDVNA